MIQTSLLDRAPAGLELRSYQQRAVDEIRQAWAHGARGVCCVVPTGGGKTVIAQHATADKRALWIVHRRELLSQVRRRIPEAQVETVQGMLARGHRPDCDILVWDECHRVAADQWSTVLSAYPDTPMLGLTATPEREDGRGLGDIFDRLVVGAQHSELIEGGWLVPCEVWAPDTLLDSGELWCHPIEALQKYGHGQAFLFARSVDDAGRFASAAREAGISCETITGETREDDRVASMQAFASGRLDVLSNVYCLVEGVDVPQATTCIIARRPMHAGSYLQMTGRVLRPAPGKTKAILLDLTGISSIHGLPTDDREYSLEGTAIRRNGEATPEPQGDDSQSATPPTKIYNAELRRVYAGSQTPERHRRSEWSRLQRLCASRGYDLAWGARQYAKLFGSPPPPSWTPEVSRRDEYRRLQALAAARGYKPGYAKVRYKMAFGTWPPRSW